MKALIKTHKNSGLELKNIDVPKIQENEVLIKIHKTGICGTDVHIYNWDDWAQNTISPPLVIGHEFYGTISAIGSNVKNLQVGDRVSGEAHLTCGICQNCRAGSKHLCPNTKGLGIHTQGAFAEFLKLPAENVYQLPDFVPDNIAAILDPLGNATHTALSFNLTCADILITGAGPIGLMATAIAKKLGAKSITITDENDFRLAIAQKLGADKIINITNNSQAVHKFAGFDVGLEMSGSFSALQQLINSSRPGANIALLGIPANNLAPVVLNWHKIIFKELTLQGIYGREIFNTWYKTVDLLQTGLDISPIITHVFSHSDFAKAFATAMSGKAGKVILSWS